MESEQQKHVNRFNRVYDNYQDSNSDVFNNSLPSPLFSFRTKKKRRKKKRKKVYRLFHPQNIIGLRGISVPLARPSKPSSSNILKVKEGCGTLDVFQISSSSSFFSEAVVEARNTRGKGKEEKNVVRCNKRINHVVHGELAWTLDLFERISFTGITSC